MLNIEPTKATRKAENKILRSQKLWEKGIMNGAKLAGRSVQQRAEKMLTTGTRTGRKYKNLPNRSSAEGEAPRSQSGRLVRSIYFNAGSSTQFSVGATARHAIFLERGTKFMGARPNPKLPWLKLSIHLEEGNTEKYLKERVLEQIC